MADRVVLTFDIGTQSCRAILINDHGELIGKKQIAYDPPYYSPELGWAEREADSYYDFMCEASSELKKKFPKAFEDIEGVSITCIRDSIVNVDKDGKPLRPAILWPDSRKAEGSPKLGAGKKAIFGAVGLSDFVDIQYKKSYVNWIMENEPEIWEKSYKVMYLSAYLTYALTGEFTDAVAATVGHLPFEVKTRSWAPANALTRPIFDVPEDMLVSLTDSGDIMGKITAKAAADSGIKEGTPVFASGSDKACEIVGLGCVKKEQAAVSFGTMATVSLNSPDYIEAQSFIAPYPSVVKGWYNPEQELYRGYWLVSWFKNEFCADEALEAAKSGKIVEEVLNEGLNEIEPGCNGLFLSPSFSPDLMKPYARGGFIGLADYHTKKHMYRAVIEGINYALMEGIRNIEKKGKFEFKELRVAGGGSRSPEICQITADMFGIPVVRTATHEASALGAAAATFVGLGVFDGFEQACAEMVHDTDRFEPNIENTKLYDKLFNVYKKLFPALKPMYQELAEIYKKEK